MAAYVRTVKTASGGTAVQIVHSTHYPGTLHDALDRIRRHSGAHRLAQLRSDSCQGAGAHTPPGGQGLWLRMAAGEQPRYAYPHRASGEVPVTTGPQDPAAAGRDRLRASHADREQVIDTLKTAFVHGRLTRDELDARAGRALAARTCADLAALTADIPPGPAAAGPARPPAPARRRPLAGAAAKSGICLIITAAAIGVAAYLDPGGPGPQPPQFWGGLMVVLAVSSLWTALGIMGYAVFTSWDQRSSRGQLPPRPGPGGAALEGEQRGGTGNGPIPPGPRTDQTRADLRAHKPRQRIPARAGRAPRGVRPAPGAV